MSIGGIGELLHPALGEEPLVALEVGRERARVAHHHLEQLDPVGAGDERPERVALVERDVCALRAVHVAARHLALEHEHDVVAVVAVRLHDHARIPFRVQREEFGREVEPLLADRRVVVAVPLPPHLLPLQIVEVGESWTSPHSGSSPARARHRACGGWIMTQRARCARRAERGARVAGSRPASTGRSSTRAW